MSYYFSFYLAPPSLPLTHLRYVQVCTHTNTHTHNRRKQDKINTSATLSISFLSHTINNYYIITQYLRCYGDNKES